MPSDPDPPACFIDGDLCHVIENVDDLEPFLMTVTSASDLWVFLASNGALTAGRRSADHAIFPYLTEDLVRDGARTTGSVTHIVARPDGGDALAWEPFGETHPDLPPVRRSLLKTTLGDVVHLQEEHPRASLTMRTTWRVSPTYGLVRTAVLTLSPHAVQTRATIIDGLRHFLPPGITARTQRELGPLLDAYKITELDESGLAWVRLNARLTDRAEAAESLAVTTVWEHGLPEPHRALSGSALRHWPGRATSSVRGERAAYLTRSDVILSPGESLRWTTVIDVDQDAAKVVALRRRLTVPDELVRSVEDDIAVARSRLRRLVGSADGFIVSGDPMADAHHAASAMFNIMRGGLPAQGDEIEREDVERFLRERNNGVADRWACALASLPERLSIHALREATRALGDPDLNRLVGEYVPLTFSRRHGDPSRPWNAFEIVVTDDHGSPRLAHQGNWRDIFQNWEALAWSFPSYTESFVRIFLNATTIDGYNPYRISRAGVDWEVPEPENPWSNIGYWSDHQIIYLSRLMELLGLQHPDRLAEMARSEHFTHADVPYRLATYAELLADPNNSVTFEGDRHARAMARVAAVGGDGRLLTRADGSLATANLSEKLLILVIAKLVNFVPEGGIWMNTQRPEWNDANNALVGRGLSVVTVAHLHRFLGLMERIVEDLPLTLTEALASAIDSVTETLSEAERVLRASDDQLAAHLRRRVMDQLGDAGTAYRAASADGGTGRMVTIDRTQLRNLLSVSRRWMARTVRLNRRHDGLYHSYNTLVLGDGTARIDHLDEMLEGQVAVLDSGVLDEVDVDQLLEALPNSRLYRADVRSYQLYPEPPIPTFLERNTIQRADWAENPLFRALIEHDDRSLIVVDDDGEAHFAAGLRNANDVRDALTRIAAVEDFADLVDSDGDAVLETFESVFRHAWYTGRSSSFFAYEGVGSVYWHMVSKLVLAIREQLDAALCSAQADPTRVQRLRAAYEQVRSGLGYRKSSHEYGAFPHDPYSHTPAGKGARQPGMTGQVKEDLLARWADCGLGYAHGRIRVDGSAPGDGDWATEPGELRYVAVDGRESRVEVPVDGLGLTIAQTPVVLRRCAAGTGHPVGEQHIAVLGPGGTILEQLSGHVLSAKSSAAVMSRSGTISCIEVTCYR